MVVEDKIECGTGFASDRLHQIGIAASESLHTKRLQYYNTSENRRIEFSFAPERRPPAGWVGSRLDHVGFYRVKDPPT